MVLALGFNDAGSGSDGWFGFCGRFGFGFRRQRSAVGFGFDGGGFGFAVGFGLNGGGFGSAMGLGLRRVCSGRREVW